MEKTDIGVLVSESLQKKLLSNNQTHLLSFLPYIQSEKEKEKYIKQIEETDLELMSNLYSIYKKNKAEKAIHSNDISFIESQFSQENLSNNMSEIIKKGNEEIAQGKIGLLILAGGLGTRLGFEKAKGLFNPQMPSNKSLFEYLCNRFLLSQLLSKERTKDINFKESTLFIMTSKHNHKDITDFFKDNNYFHLKKENVIFFPQNEVCSLDFNGKVINISPSELYQAPDGNGGCFTAMKQNKIIQICKERQIDFINVVSIDNPLFKVLDPLFVGTICLKGKCGINQMGAKFVKKVDVNERVGLFLNFKNHPMMLDYMEVPAELREKRRDNGDLVYNASNILDYLISVNFLDKILNDESRFKELINEFHILKKKFNACYVDEKEKNVKYVKDVDGLKFEIFFNSIFEFAEKEGLLLLEIKREEEFAPIKNKDGETSNTPTITRMKMSNFFKTKYKQVGGEIINDSNDKILEFSLLINFDGETNETFFTKYPYIPKKIDLNNYEKGVYFKNETIEH